MKGHVQLCSLSQYKNYKDNYTKKLFIVRSPGKVNAEQYGMVHVPELAPSPELFKTYQTRWKYNKFTEEEKKIITPAGDWFYLYTVEYIKQMYNDPDMKMCIDRIQELLDEGTNVLLVCFCGSYENCHRSILGDYYAQLGYEVRYA